MRFLLISIIFLSTIIQLNAQTPVSLSEAIEIALSNNYQIRITERQVDIAENNNTWKNTGRYPTIDFNLSSNNAFVSSNNPASFIPNVNNVSAGLTPSLDLRWTIFDGYKFKISKRQLNQLQFQNESQVATAVENTIRAVMLSYYQAIIQKEQLDVLKELIILDKERIENDRVRDEFGQGGKFNLLQSQDALLNDSTTLLVQENSYVIALQNLKLAMGIDDVNMVYVPNESLEFQAEKYDLSEMEEKMFAANTNLKQLYIARELGKISTDFAKSNRYPTITLGSGVSFTENIFWQSGTNPFTMEKFGSDFSNNFNYYLNGTLSYRLYDVGVRKRAIQNAKMEEEIAAWNIDDLKRNLSNQLANTLTNYQNQVRLVRMTEKLIINAQQNIDIAKERFDAGQISSFDYRTIQLAYLNANQSKLNAIFNLKNTEIELTRLIGGLVR